jgi:hypothetical protein
VVRRSEAQVDMCGRGRMAGCVNGRGGMNGWVHGRMDGCRYGCERGWTDWCRGECVSRFVKRWTASYVSASMFGKGKGWMCVCVSVWTNGDWI